MTAGMRQNKREGPAIDSVPITFRHRIPISRTQRFWEGLREGKLYATRCRRCGVVYFPPQADCPADMSGEMEWVELPREGVVEAFAKVYARPQGFDDLEPYVVAIATLSNGVRVMGWLEPADEKCIKVGGPVEVGVKEVKGRHIVSMRYREKC